MTTQNRRGEYRLPAGTLVFVEKRAATPGRPAELLLCGGVDLSANGLQAMLDEPLPQGAILNLAVDTGPARSPLRLVAEVRWQRAQDGRWAVGFGLFESDDTDIVAWKELVAGWLASPG